MDPETEPVQPAESGQGGAGSDTPYAEYLNRIPEEVRGDVEPIFKEWDGQVTKRFQDAAEYRKNWEPYETLGVNRLPTDEVQWLMQFRDALNSPDSIKEWYESYAEANGLTPAQAAEAAQQAPPVVDEYGLVPETQQLEQLLKAQLDPIQKQMQQLASWREQQEQQTRLAEAERYVQGQMEELKAKHPAEYNEPAITKLVAQYVENDPRNAVQRAFADWQAIRSQIEKDTLQSKVDQPPPAESGGVANGAPEEIKTLARAAEIARERIRQSWSQ